MNYLGYWKVCIHCWPLNTVCGNVRVQEMCSESTGIPSNNNNKKCNKLIVQLMPWRYNMANTCSVVNSYCNMKYIQMIICKYKIKLKSEQEFEFIRVRTCMYIDSKEKEWDDNTRTLKITILILQKVLIYIIPIMHLNLNMG